MGLNNLKPANGSRSSKKRIGRGNASGQGRTAGKGHKGYKSRSGTKAKLHFEGGQTPLARRLPKRGMSKGKFNHLPSKSKIQIINISDLNSLNLKDVNKEILYEKKIIKHTKYPVKVLGDGSIDSSISVNVEYFSASAKEKIEKAGGKAEVLC